MADKPSYPRSTQYILNRMGVISENLPNGSTRALPPGPGAALVVWGSTDFCIISWTDAGVPTILISADTTPLCVTTDTAGKLCVLDGGTNVNLKNRYGADVYLMVLYIGKP